MSFPGLPVFLLPPRPALRDWPPAGACAGLLLALAELLLAAPGGPPPRLALLGAASLAIAFALVALLLGAALQTLGQRPSYSALVAWVAGLIPLAAAAPLALPRPGDSGILPLALLAIAGFAAVGMAFAAAQLADRSERAGMPANAVLCWGGVALLVAASESLLLGERGLGGLALALMAGAVLTGAAAAGAIFLLSRRRGTSRPRASFGALLTGLLAATWPRRMRPPRCPGCWQGTRRRRPAMFPRTSWSSPSAPPRELRRRRTPVQRARSPAGPGSATSRWCRRRSGRSRRCSRFRTALRWFRH